MTDPLRIALADLLHKYDADANTDLLRDGVRVLAEELMDLEVSQQLAAAPYERTGDRAGYRNGTRTRQWDTRVGTIALQVPRIRDGSYVPLLLEPRRRAERALTAVVQEAYIHGVSTRRVESLVQALGMEGISKSQVSRLCQTLDTELAQFAQRPLTGACPYVWLDATYVKVREQGRVVSMAVVIAIGLLANGEREVLGYDIGHSEDGAFWRQFLRGLVARGLSGVQLVISDAHAGLTEAITTVFLGASWQRCRVHFIRNALAQVPKTAAQMVAAAIRTVFVQPDAASARAQWRKVTEQFAAPFPKLARLLETAEADVLAYLAFPPEHWTKIWSNNPLERLNKEIKRRSNVVEIFPNRAAALRLIGAILAEQHDEWQTGKRYVSAESLAKLTAPREEAAPPLAIAS